jgi:hypothetical protein
MHAAINQSIQTLVVGDLHDVNQLFSHDPTGFSRTNSSMAVCYARLHRWNSYRPGGPAIGAVRIRVRARSKVHITVENQGQSRRSSDSGRCSMVRSCMA